jgi:hypothetical protein
MPKKKRPESQAEQSARFRAEVEKLIAAGELSPTDAEEGLERLLAREKRKPLSRV